MYVKQPNGLINMTDAIKIEVNSIGKDFIIGDVHGRAAELHVVIKMMGDNDRLFIVGDLIDRGPNSEAVIQYIHDRNTSHPGSVMAIRGNHEDDFLSVCGILENFTAWDNLNKAEQYQLSFFIYNGGGWVFQDPTLTQALSNIPNQKNPDLIPTVVGDIMRDFSITIKDLRGMQEYITALPYIIKVGETEDPQGFIVTHADMNQTDEEIDTILSKGGMLDPDMVIHIIEARPEAFSYIRDADSMICYVGHNSLGLSKAISSVRAETNTVNIDASKSDYFIVVNHTDHSAFMVGVKENGRLFSQIQNCTQEISEHLTQKLTLREEVFERDLSDELHSRESLYDITNEYRRELQGLSGEFKGENNNGPKSST
jgi:hypothetical protein